MMSLDGLGDDSMEKAIHLSEKAKAHLERVIVKNQGAVGVSLELVKSGCAGYMYQLNLVYEMLQSGYCQIFTADICLYIKTSQWNSLNGLLIDCVQEDAFSSKLVYSNPNVKMACGCGESVELD